jgi:hypothetical protein
MTKHEMYVKLLSVYEKVSNLQFADSILMFNAKKDLQEVIKEFSKVTHE